MIGEATPGEPIGKRYRSTSQNDSRGCFPFVRCAERSKPYKNQQTSPQQTFSRYGTLGARQGTSGGGWGWCGCREIHVVVRRFLGCYMVICLPVILAVKGKRTANLGLMMFDSSSFGWLHVTTLGVFRLSPFKISGGEFSTPFPLPENLSLRTYRINIWLFPKIGVPQNGWFTM